MANARKFLEFVDASPSPFHAVSTITRRLEAAGYKRLSESDVEGWKKVLVPGGRYYFTRNQSTALAFAVGKKFSPGNGFNIIGAHTDSPCLRLKPTSNITSHGYLQVGVQTYGGGLWNTWFDRDLSVAGRVVIKLGESFEHRLVRINEPILRVPTLCIHLDHSVREAFKFNKETQLLPVLATAVKDSLGNTGNGADKAKEGADTKVYPQGAHHAVLVQLLAKQLGCAEADIRDFELSLYDTQPASLGGAFGEFVFAPRLDNLMCCFTSLEGLISASSDENLEEETNVQVAVMFDNEEVGSVSANGAASSLVEHFIRRVTSVFAKDTRPVEEVEIAVRNSFLISADMAHALHPNYSDKHEPRHQPQIHKGVVIKTNANQRYATNSITAFLLREIAQRNGIPIQEFVVRNDSTCGSTIGPMLSARGIRTIDIGGPQLSMHSIREMMGTDDVDHLLNLCTAFYVNFSAIDRTLKVD